MVEPGPRCDSGCSMASITDNQCLSVDPISGPSDPLAVWHSACSRSRPLLLAARLDGGRRALAAPLLEVLLGARLGARGCVLVRSR